MVRHLLLSTVLVATLAQAQQTTRTRLTAMPADLPSPSASNLTIKGCVNGEKNTFTLFQVSTGASFDLLKGKTDFNRFRGNLVVVKANEFAPTRRNGLKSLPQLKVSDLRVVAEQCPVQGRGRPASRAVSTAVQGQPPSPATPRYQRNGDTEQRPPTQVGERKGAGRSRTQGPGTGKPNPEAEDGAGKVQEGKVGNGRARLYDA